MLPQVDCYFRPLYEVASVINSSLEPQEVLQKIVEGVMTAMRGKACTLRLLDRSGEYLLASASSGLSKGYLRKGQVEVKKSRLDTELLAAGSPIYVTDASKEVRFQYPEQAKSEGLVSVLSAPLKVEGKAIGVLRVYTSEERQFSQDEKDFLMAVSHISAIAIENARLHNALKADYELLTKYNYQIFED